MIHQEKNCTLNTHYKTIWRTFMCHQWRLTQREVYWQVVYRGQSSVDNSEFLYNCTFILKHKILLQFPFIWKQNWRIENTDNCLVVFLGVTCHIKSIPTLTPIWFPHWPACRCTISLICSSSRVTCKNSVLPGKALKMDTCVDPQRGSIYPLWFGGFLLGWVSTERVVSWKVLLQLEDRNTSRGFGWLSGVAGGSKPS